MNVEWGALAVSMLQRVGALRDVRSRPMLHAAFKSNARPEIVRAAAGALGRLGGEQDFALLIMHAKEGDPRFLPAIEGLGYVWRIESAKHLAALLASSSDDAALEEIADALGTVGSSWGWRALGPKYQAEGLEV